MPYCKVCGREISSEQRDNYKATCPNCLNSSTKNIIQTGTINRTNAVLCEWENCNNPASSYCPTCKRQICPAHSIRGKTINGVTSVKCPRCGAKDAKNWRLFYIIAGSALGIIIIISMIVRNI